MRPSRILAALLPAVATCLLQAGEEELEVNLQTGRRTLEADPLVLPQWSAEDLAAFAAGNPVNLGGGLWSEERYPLEPRKPLPSPPVIGEAEIEFVRPVDLRALEHSPSPIASAAGPEAAALLRTAPRVHTPRWRSVFTALQLLVGGAAVAIGWRIRRHRLRPRIFQFPESESAARLGGPHCGGSGAVLRW
jgi:hypothetical protein